jgi:Fe2+ or Zn2+ uptake regulation protein
LTTWRETPLRQELLDVLQERRGAMRENDLVRVLTSRNKEISEADINSTLLSLEIEGKIHVEYMGKNERKIEILKKAELLQIGED